MGIPDPSLGPVAATPNLAAHSWEDAALWEKFGFYRSDLAGAQDTHALQSFLPAPSWGFVDVLQPD